MRRFEKMTIMTYPVKQYETDINIFWPKKAAILYDIIASPFVNFVIFPIHLFINSGDVNYCLFTIHVELLIVCEERHENRAVGPIFDTVANIHCGLPRWLSGKNPPPNAGNVGLIPELGSYPGEGNDNPLQYSCLGNPMDRGAWWATVCGVAKSQTQLSDWVCMHSLWGAAKLLQSCPTLCDPIDGSPPLGHYGVNDLNYPFSCKSITKGLKRFQRWETQIDKTVLCFSLGICTNIAFTLQLIQLKVIAVCKITWIGEINTRVMISTPKWPSVYAGILWNHSFMV